MVPIMATVLWGPFAIAVMGGLAVATMMTLFCLPALYVLWFQVKEPPVQGSSRAENVLTPPAKSVVATHV
jgi:hypothetical protein